MNLLTIEEGILHLSQGKVIAYPTEAVFGLGCCPKNENALNRICQLKKRSLHKGMILIASEIEQLLPYIEISKIPKARWDIIQKSWPGPFTWIFPATDDVPLLLKGQFDSVAVRVTAHPTAMALCQAFKGAIVSTSANISNAQPLKNAQEVYQVFAHKIAGIVAGNLGDALKPTKIQHALTGEVVRA